MKRGFSVILWGIILAFGLVGVLPPRAMAQIVLSASGVASVAPLTLDSGNSRVGIGQATPVATLHIARSSAVRMVLLERPDQPSFLPVEIDVDSGTFVVSPESGTGALSKTTSIEIAKIDGAGTQVFSLALSEDRIATAGSAFRIMNAAQSAYLQIITDSILLNGDSSSDSRIYATKAGLTIRDAGTSQPTTTLTVGPIQSQGTGDSAFTGGTLVLGAGEGTATLTTRTFRGPNAVGTDIAGVATALEASRGTGTGTAGTLTLAGTVTKAATGTTAHTRAVLITVGHTQTAHPDTAGALVDYPAVTWTDETTAASGTAAKAMMYVYHQPVMAARNATVTTTTAATLAISNAPTAGTNMTLTTTVPLWVGIGQSTSAGGGASKCMLFGSAPAVGICFGSGAPTLSFFKGSLYLRTDGSGIADRAYIATDAVGTWASITTGG